MLETLSHETLRTRLGLQANGQGAPEVGIIAETARKCVGLWRSPPRARLTAYLHRQLLAGGFEEEQVRHRVGDVVDALIDIGDMTSVRLNGKLSLVLSRASFVEVRDFGYIPLGQSSESSLITIDPRRYARLVPELPDNISAIDFSNWLGTPGFQPYLARRTGGSGQGSIAEFWSTLQSQVRHEGNPLDAGLFRAIVDPPGSHDGFFGRHNLPTVSGRWSTKPKDGEWCGVRPGRNPNEWHPIVVRVSGSEINAFDLYDWDEWNWALVARGVALGAPERAQWTDNILSFEYRAPDQFVRALRLLGGPGDRAWTWQISEPAYRAFDAWCRAEI